jgi:hypothetical protein
MINCENCIYFKNMMANSVQGVGKCIRYAPRTGDVQTGGFWPFVYFDQACGEFVSKFDSNDYISNYEYEDECSE